jgi:hypothetical protein
MRPTADKTVLVEVHLLRHCDLNGSDENIDPVRGTLLDTNQSVP